MLVSRTAPVAVVVFVVCVCFTKIEIRSFFIYKTKINYFSFTLTSFQIILP